MESTFEMNCEGALAVIALVVIMTAIGLPFLPREEFIVVLFSDGTPIQSSAKTWFRKPRRKPPDKSKSSVARAPILQLIVESFFQIKEPIREGRREREKVVSKTDKRNRKENFQEQFLPFRFCWLIVVLILNATATAIKIHEASKEPWESNLKPEAMASSANNFREEKSRHEIPAIERARQYVEKGNETLHIKSKDKKMLVNIKAKGEVREPEQLTSNNNVFASARLDEDGSDESKQAQISGRNRNIIHPFKVLSNRELPEGKGGSQRDGNRSRGGDHFKDIVIIVSDKKNNWGCKKSGLGQKVSKIGTREAKINLSEVPIGSYENHTESPETRVLHGGELSLVSYDFTFHCFLRLRKVSVDILHSHY